MIVYSRMLRLTRCFTNTVLVSQRRNKSGLYSKYPFLKELGIKEENSGCYDGEWFGSGAPLTAVNPSNNQPIAQVSTVRVIVDVR